MLIGGDLAGMQALAGDFQTSGTEFDAKSTQIATRVQEALTAFVQEMKRLDARAEELADQITTEMGRLEAKAGETEWTGENRRKADQLVTGLRGEIDGLHAAIVKFATDADSVVQGELSSTMQNLDQNVRSAGQAAKSTATRFSDSVTSQRNAFDRVLNG